MGIQRPKKLSLNWSYLKITLSFNLKSNDWCSLSVLYAKYKLDSESKIIIFISFLSVFFTSSTKPYNLIKKKTVIALSLFNFCAFISKDSISGAFSAGFLKIL